MSISKQVVSRPVLVVIVFALLSIVGLYTLTDLAIELFPETSMPMLFVSTTYSSAGPETVEKSVTRVLEGVLTNLSGLKNMTSTSSEGSSRIELEFDYGTNLDVAVNEIRDKLDRVKNSLPDDASTPQIFKFDPNSMPIMRIAVRGNRSAEQLKSYAESYIQPRLEQVSGVAQANVQGGRDKIVKIELSQNRLDAYDLTVTSVAAALATQNVELGGGSVSEGTKEYLVRTTGEYKRLDEIANTLITIKNGYGVKLSDLGTVSEGYEDLTSLVYINGTPGVYISIQKQSGTNTITAADGVYKKIEEVKKILPADISLDIISDDTQTIRSTINDLISSALQGAILAMAILFLFLRSIKSTVIIGISIPLSMLITLLAMKLAGITLNMMTLTGLILGVGMIVDASIVMIENIYQYRERGTKPDVAAILGSHEMIAAVISSNLTTICVFIPLIFFKNKLEMIGQLFQDTIFTIFIALLSSLFVAIFLVPVLASKYLVLSTRKDQPLHNRILIFLDSLLEKALNSLVQGYRKALTLAMHHRPTAILIVVGFLGISFAVLPRMNISFMPRFGDDSVTLRATLPVGTTLQETERVMRQMESYAQQEIRGIKSIITNVGSGGGFGSASSYSGSLNIQLDATNAQNDTSDAVKTKLRRHFSEFPNVSFSFSAGRAQQMQGGMDIDIALRVMDLNTGIQVAKDMIELLKSEVPDISEPTMDLTEGLPQIEVVIDRERAYSFGITVQAAAKEIEACVDGTTATVYQKDGNEYNVVVRLQESDRSRMPDLERIYVQGTKGRVPLANFATLEKGYGPVSIIRENQTRVIHITANITSGERADKVEQKIQQVINTKMIIPDGVVINFEGSWQNLQKQGSVFVLILTMAILLVFGVMAGQYESFKDPFINLFTIPLAIIGVVLIYVITGQPLSMFTAMGLVMLAGIVVNNGIILVDYTNLLVRRGTPLIEACIQGGTSRLRPVLMTTLTTILGLIPMAFFPSESSQMIQPIGLTVIGGLSSSTFITLFIIPVIYSYFNQNRHRANKESSR
jgi:HAE1 family hydrophobic/amphiphilic exporter-1